MASKNARRNWFGTCHNIDTQLMTKDQFDKQDKIKYIIWQHETGSETQKDHFQWFINTHKPQRFSAIVKIIPQLAKQHYEEAEKPEACIKYCSKEDTRKEGPWEFGVYIAKGERSDLDIIKEKLLDGVSEKQISLDHFSQWIYHYRAFDKFRKMHQAPLVHEYELEDYILPRCDLTKPLLIWGLSGAGKTPFALAHFKNPLMVSDIDDLHGLTPDHDGIVFDDMSFKHFPKTARIHLLDIKYTRSIRCRHTNATIPAGMPRIFTNNNEDIFLDGTEDTEEYRAITRRYSTLHVEKFLGKSKRNELECNEVVPCNTPCRGELLLEE